MQMHDYEFGFLHANARHERLATTNSVYDYLQDQTLQPEREKMILPYPGQHIRKRENVLLRQFSIFPSSPLPGHIMPREGGD